MAAVIEIKGLTKKFEELTAVDGLQFAIEEGEMFGIVGPDGAGKTTTFRMLAGILLPTSGTATIVGHDLIKDSRKIKREIGYLSQRFSLYGDLTVDENIEFFAEINEVYDYKARREELLEFTRLTPFRDRLAEQLSGGMRKKLALACTLVYRPRILFLDEPTTGVDPVSRRDLWRILSSLLESRITIVLSTVYLDEAERCTRVALMNLGKVMLVDTPTNMKKLMDGEVVEITCDQIRPASKLLKSHPQVRGVQTFGDRLNIILRDSKKDLPLVKAALHEAKIRVLEVRLIAPSLENIFISLMSQQKTSKSSP